MKHLLLALVAVASGARAYSQTNIYVSTTGASTGNGTSTSSPVNLTRAQARVREINASMSADINVQLMTGTYALTGPITLTDLDSGFNGYTVRWMAQDTSNPPLISGGQQITGWTQSGTSGIWYATVPNVAFRQVWVNAQRRQRARSEGFVSIKDVVKNTANNTRIILAEASSLPATVTDWSRAELHSYHDWRDYYVTLNGAASYSDARYEQPIMGLVAPGSEWGDVVGGVAFQPDLSAAWLENAFELLDQPHEWYADAATNRLYYIPSSDEDLTSSNTRVFIPMQQTLLKIQGSSSSARAHNLEFNTLRFQYSTWTAVNGTGYVPIQSAEFQRPSNGYFPGAVEVANAQQINFKDNRFAHLGASAMNLSQWDSNIQITGNAFTDIAACGIQAGPHSLSPSTGIATSITIKDNLFYQYAQDYRAAVGFCSYSLRDSSLIHNHFENSPYEPIDVGDFNSNGSGYNNTSSICETGNNTITFNRIRNFDKYCRDGGGIYINGSQRGSDGVQRTSMVSDNFIQDWWTDEGALYSEDHSGNITYQRNVCELTLNTPGLGIHNRTWLYAWSANSYNLTLGSGSNANYATTNLSSLYNTADQNVSGHQYVAPVTYTDPSTRPSGATSIINASGVETTYSNYSYLMSLLPSGTNQAPVVSISPDTTCALGQTIALQASVTDDGLPYDRLVYAWSKTSGPGDVTFSTTSALKTTAAFSASGSYVLQLSVKDGALETIDQMNVTVSATSVGINKAAGVIPTASASYFSDWSPAALTDGSFSTDYKSGIWLATGGAWLQLDLGTAVRPSQIVIGARNGNADERSNFSIRGSNTSDFSSYVILAGQGKDPYRNTGRWVANLTTTSAFRYYRLQSSGNISASEFQVYSGGSSQIFEAEGLTVAATSGATHRIVNDVRYSCSNGTILDATVVGDYVTYLLPNIPAGSYDVRIGVKNFNTRGTWQLSAGRADNFAGTVSTIGTTQDGYNAAETFTEIDLGAWSPVSSNDKWFQFKIAGKNGSSTGYTESFDYIKLIAQ